MKESQMKIKRVSSMVKKIEEDFDVEGSLAVLTSGGDSQGMNAAVRAVVRTCVYKKIPVYAVMEGFEGLIDGGNSIKLMNRESVSNIMNIGGTIIGSARSDRFRTKEGRYMATINMLNRNIRNLVVIGGDGSLTGADIFRSEWSDNVKKAKQEGLISKDESNSELKIIGIVASIDNDFVNSPMTIGTDSALNRICESIDSIEDTASSHQRAFVIEVMGRNCGYLAIASSVCCVADYVLLPEVCWSDDWKNHMSKCIKNNRKEGKRTTIVIVAEGALAKDGSAITSQEVFEVLKNDLNLDTRITVLGHVQRGGRPSAFDRLIASRIGCDAVFTMMSEDYSIPMIVSIQNDSTLLLPMSESIELTKQIIEKLKNFQFEELLRIRGNYFKNFIVAYETLSHALLEKDNDLLADKNVAIIHDGLPVSGMNAATAAIVRYFKKRGFGIKAVKNGLMALFGNYASRSNMIDININDTHGLYNKPGSILGTKLPDHCLKNETINLDTFNDILRTENIKAIIILGSRDTLYKLKELENHRHEFQNPQLPIVTIPCSTSNNINCSQFAIGSDTCINQTVAMIDNLRYYNSGYGKTLNFVVIKGSNSQYVPIMTSLACGVTRFYTSRNKYSLNELCEHARAYQVGTHASECGVIICTDDIDNQSSMKIDNLVAIYQKELKGIVNCIRCDLGQFQFGAKPSPYDRKLAARFAISACETILDDLKSISSNGLDEYTKILIFKNGKINNISIKSISGLDPEGQDCLEDPNDWSNFLQNLVKILGDEFKEFV